MNVKKFSDAMSELDSKYIDEALNYKKESKKARLGKMGRYGSVPVHSLGIGSVNKVPYFR